MALINDPFNKSPKLEWQKLKSNNCNVPDVYRTPVFGGWLISHGWEGGLSFVPDPNHQWDGESAFPPLLD